MPRGNPEAEPEELLVNKLIVKRVGPRVCYVDARDPQGRLRLGDGTLVNTHTFKHLDCIGTALKPVSPLEGTEP